MNHENKHDALERNIEQMLSAGRGQASPDFERRLSEAVGRQVRRQRYTRLQRRWFVRVAAAAAVLILAVLIVPERESPIGTISDIRGLVEVRNGGRSELIGGTQSLHAEQWVRTRSGTTAQVVLTDQSRLTPRPRTVMQLDRHKHGHAVRLQQGSVAIAAHKQPRGNYLKVETPGTAIKVLGTELDVRVVEKPTGVKQTRVHLHSGSIEVASGGVTARLLPGMVAVTQEGKPPIAESSVPEVNELRRLWARTRERAAPLGVRPNVPMIIDYVNPNVWVMVPLSEFARDAAGGYSLRLKYPAFRVQAYTQDGARASVRDAGRVIHVDLSGRDPGAEPVTHVILRIPHATGLFRVEQANTHELTAPAADEASVTLVQLALPKSAVVSALQGEIVEESKRFGRLTVTIAADAETLAVYE